MVERFFVNHHRLLTDAAAQTRTEQLNEKSSVSLPLSFEAHQNAAISKPIPARRQKLFDSIKELQASGKSLRGIARELKIARNTVRRYVICKSAPPHKSGAGKPSSVLPFAAYLETRWRMGEHNGFRLWQEIKERGFGGEVDAVQRFIRPWRAVAVGKPPHLVAVRGLAPRKVTKLLLNPEQTMTEAERNYLKKLLEIAPAARRMQCLGIEFGRMVKERRADLFDDWLAQVRRSGIREVQSWAQGLLADEAAVRNAFRSPWSNGQTEGQVNRLKTIKRQMYGRANFDLLRARVLHQD